MWTGCYELIRCLVLLTILSNILLGCVSIVSEAPLLSDTARAPNVQKTYDARYYYYVGPTWDSTFPSEMALLKQVFLEYVTTEAVAASVPPERGLYVRVSQTMKREPPTILERFSRFTVYVIPYYREGVQYIVDYDLYIDAALRKTYHYEIRHKSFNWVAAIPFSWINFWTNSHTSAFEATIHQFIRDAHTEGF